VTSAELATLLVAVIGAVTGVLGLGLSILNYRRDRASIRVEVGSGYMGGADVDDFDGPFVFVSAVNAGRRAASLRSAGLLLTGGRRFWIKPGLPGQPNALAGTLVESDERRVWVHYDALVGELRLEDGVLVPEYGYVEDTTGRIWKAPVSVALQDEVRHRVGRAQARLRKEPSS
jgi:hypothetical protein